MNSISIGKNNKVEHPWCILFGDNLSTTKNYDIQFSLNVTVPSSININHLQNLLNAKFVEFKEHSTTPGLPGRPPSWIESVSAVLVGINMALGKAEKCHRKGCDNSTSSSGMESVCEKCRNVKYCSFECKELNATAHQKFCLRVEVRKRDPSAEFTRYLYTLESSVRGLWKWTPTTALDQGLFATQLIKKGEVIAYFKGEITTLTDGEPGDEWYLPIEDGKIFIPSKDDVAHIAMDPSFSPPGLRNFLEVLSSPVSILPTLGALQNILSEGTGSICNATSVWSNAQKVLALVATRDINPEEEIFFHRGFPYHFLSECQKGWVLPEGILDDLPANIYSSPGFKSYVNLYHPKANRLYISSMDRENTCFKIQIVTLPSGNLHLEVFFEELKEAPQGTVTMVLPDYRKYMSVFV